MNQLLKHAKPQKSTSDITVGLPSSMMFYAHGELWEDFFSKLGCHVEKSGPTSREILNRGVSLCSSEVCMPVKVFTGHVDALAKRTDYVFIPRYISMGRHEMDCPKFCGLPDMVRINLHNKVNLMEIDIDFDKGTEKTKASLGSISNTLGIDYETVKDIFVNSVQNKLDTDMKVGTVEPGIKNMPSIAVLGHPYMIYDEMLSMGLISKLKQKNFQVLTPNSLTRNVRRSHLPIFKNRNFYELGSDILGSASAFLELPQVKGMIYLSPFACGIDSLVTEFIERHLHNTEKNMPFMKITVDEHTGEAGFDTRLEAFLDMIED
jgi:predicted nucleotide-binding protein (sugar kinase/HSP70/actin superfamily)